MLHKKRVNGTILASFVLLNCIIFVKSLITMTKMTKATLRSTNHFLVTPSDFTVQFRITKENYEEFFKGNEEQASDSGDGHDIRKFK